MKKKYSSLVVLLFILFFLSNPLNARTATDKPAVRNYKSFISNNSIAYEIEKHRVWLNLTNNEGLFKQLLIGYIDGATNGFDQNYDAVTANANKYADFYSINEGKKLVIQGRGLPFLTTDMIPLGYRSEIAGELRISIDQADGKLTDQDIYIEDRKTGTIHNLKKSLYTFSTEKGVFTDRFILRYSAAASLGTDEVTIADSKVLIASRNKIVTLKSYGSALEDVAVYDITGRLVCSRANLNTFDLELADIQSDNQVLLIKALFEDGNTITKKVIF